MTTRNKLLSNISATIRWLDHASIETVRMMEHFTISVTYELLMLQVRVQMFISGNHT
ncbi:MAG: hypothetical protein LBM96_10790 [Methanobrevibacter sp.]|nr:hypothetical protein [Candidatus Methanoflexus mossambicus]